MTVTRRAFVAGATGYTGQALVAALTRAGVVTVAHVRPDSARLAEWRAHFEKMGAVCDASAWTHPAMTEAVARAAPDAVFALLGTTRRRVAAAQKHGAADSYQTVDYGLASTLLRATLEAAPRARFVYLSSLGVAPGARGEYLRVRWRMEEELKASDVAWAIARPSFITGADRAENRPLERLLAAVSDTLLDAVALAGGRGVRNRYRSMTATELAAGLAHHAFSPGSAGRILSTEDLRVTA